MKNQYSFDQDFDGVKLQFKVDLTKTIAIAEDLEKDTDAARWSYEEYYTKDADRPSRKIEDIAHEPSAFTLIEEFVTISAVVMNGSSCEVSALNSLTEEQKEGFFGFLFEVLNDEEGELLCSYDNT